MKTSSSLLLAVLLAAAQVHAADEGEKKKAAAKKSANSDRNVAQKAESSIGEFLHRNKIWTRREKK